MPHWRGQSLGNVINYEFYGPLFSRFVDSGETRNSYLNDVTRLRASPRHGGQDGFGFFMNRSASGAPFIEAPAVIINWIYGCNLSRQIHDEFQGSHLNPVKDPVMSLG